DQRDRPRLGGLRLYNSFGREVATAFADPFLNATRATISFTTGPRDPFWGDMATYYTLGVSDYTNLAYDPDVEGAGATPWQQDYHLNLTLTPVEAGDSLTDSRDTHVSWKGGSYSTEAHLGDGAYGNRDVDVYRFEALVGATVAAETGQPKTG